MLTLNWGGLVKTTIAIFKKVLYISANRVGYLNNQVKC